MIRWFRRRPRPAPKIDTKYLADMLTLAAWGLSRLDWADMTDQQRAWHRSNITKAPHFTS